MLVIRLMIRRVEEDMMGCVLPVAVRTRTERKGSIERIFQQMNGAKRYGPHAKVTALRITVLGNGRGMLDWLVLVEKKLGNNSIAGGWQP
jgi:hypothetical protein